MTKQELLDLLKLLSALESWSFASTHTLPEYLYDKIDMAILIVEREIVKP